MKIAVIKGDGIGEEIINEGIKVIEKIGKKSSLDFELEYVDAGGISIDKYSTPLTDEALNVCKSSDAVLLGAVGGPKWDDAPIRPEQGLLALRKGMNLFANLRPAVLHKSLKNSSPLKSEIIGDELDIMIIRELTGGIYFGKHGRDENSAYDIEEYSVMEIERIAHVGFKTAQKRNKLLTSVDKANVLTSSKLWRDVVINVSKNYPDVELNHMYVDNAAMQLIRNPKQFDVIVTSNIFGDILSDEASMLTGSIGLLPSASLGEGTLGMYEPIHGSAPDIAGKNMANPIATILSVAMMFKYSLGLNKEAEIIENAVTKVLSKGFRTRDILEDKKALVNTSKMGDLICDEIDTLYEN